MCIFYLLALLIFKSLCLCLDISLKVTGTYLIILCEHFKQNEGAAPYKKMAVPAMQHCLNPHFILAVIPWLIPLLESLL